MKNKPDPLTADSAPLAFAEAEPIAAEDVQPLGSHGGLGSGESQEGAGCDGFAGAGFSDNPDSLARVDGQIQSPHGLHISVSAGEANVEVTDVDERRHHPLLSYRACQARPATVEQMTVTVSTTPGTIPVHQATRR